MARRRQPCLIVDFPDRVRDHLRLVELDSIEGLANDLDGSILTRGFTTSPFDIEHVLNEWQRVDSLDGCPARPTMRIVTAGAWDIDETIAAPQITTLRSVDPREFETVDAVDG